MSETLFDTVNTVRGLNKEARTKHVQMRYAPLMPALRLNT